jgi:hypothetical protein
MRCLPALLLVLAFAFARPVSADTKPLPWSQSGGPRVRPADARIASLLLDGMRRSPSLADLVDRVEASNVIVYLELQPSLTDHLMGCLTWMGKVAGYRYVRASLNPDMATDTLIAAIGHELRHVVEIIENPSVTDEASLRSLYQRIGVRGKELDTQDAQNAGATVRKDLRTTRTTGAIPGEGAMSPLRWHTWYRQRQGLDAAAR